MCSSYWLAILTDRLETANGGARIGLLFYHAGGFLTLPEASMHFASSCSRIGNTVGGIVARSNALVALVAGFVKQQVLCVC